MRINQFAALIYLAGVVLALGSCMNTGSTSGSNERSLSSGPSIMEYRIGPSDVLTISVWNQEELNATVIVRPDGMISYPLLGGVYVTGMTPEELQQLVATELADYINIQPREVSVVVDAVHSYAVSVLGEVNDPGRFEFQSQATVLDALASAGGLTEFASRSRIVILRPENDGVRRISFNYRQAIRASETTPQMVVFPGDTILVP